MHSLEFYKSMYSLADTNLRSDGLLAFANAIEDFPILRILDLSQNRLGHNSADEKRLSGLESLCNVLWQVKTLRDIRFVAQ